MGAQKRDFLPQVRFSASRSRIRSISAPSLRVLILLPDLASNSDWTANYRDKMRHPAVHLHAAHHQLLAPLSGRRGLCRSEQYITIPFCDRLRASTSCGRVNIDRSVPPIDTPLDVESNGRGGGDHGIPGTVSGTVSSFHFRLGPAPCGTTSSVSTGTITRDSFVSDTSITAYWQPDRHFVRVTQTGSGSEEDIAYSATILSLAPHSSPERGGDRERRMRCAYPPYIRIVGRIRTTLAGDGTARNVRQVTRAWGAPDGCCVQHEAAGSDLAAWIVNSRRPILELAIGRIPRLINL